MGEPGSLTVQQNRILRHLEAYQPERVNREKEQKTLIETVERLDDRRAEYVVRRQPEIKKVLQDNHPSLARIQLEAMALRKAREEALRHVTQMPKDGPPADDLDAQERT
jgi:hypothetical protein